jgi:hypothetical protein
MRCSGSACVGQAKRSWFPGRLRGQLVAMLVSADCQEESPSRLAGCKEIISMGGGSQLVCV